MIHKKIELRCTYIAVSAIIYYFLINYFDYEVKYLMNLIFVVYMIFQYVFEQIDFYEQRYRLRDIFVNGLINVSFAVCIFVFLKRMDAFAIYFVLFVLQNLMKILISKKYVKRKNVLIFGSDHLKQNIQEELIVNLDYNYIGYISDEESVKSKYYLSRYEKLEKIIEEQNIEILVIVKNMRCENFKKYIKRIFKLKLKGLKIMDYAEFNERIQRKIDLSYIDEEWLIQENGFEILNNETQKKLKRGLDIGLSIFLLILLSPVFLIIVIMIKLESKGSIFFKQTRTGKNLKEFKVYKFRSMKEHDKKKYSRYVQKDDKRITKVGKVIRKLRIDELPQLWNILKGEMSFVGPRPEWNVLAKKYEKEIPYYNLRHLIKPGLTGWAQVMYPYGENVEDTKKKLEYDLYYIKRQSFLLDVLTILKTVKVVLYMRGR